MSVVIKSGPLSRSSSGSPLRDLFWPVYGEEHKGFLPMAVIIFFTLFNYTVLRSVKDACIITNSGVETLTFIKFWLTVPGLFFFFLFYVKVVNNISKKKLYYGIVTSFLVFFVLFAWVLYPNRDLLHPTVSADWLRGFLPTADWADHMVDMYRYWTLSMLFVVAEMWNSVVLLFLFWQLANSVTTVANAKRFYPHLICLGHLGLFAAGALLRIVTTRPVPTGCVDRWEPMLQILLTIVAVNCAIILLAYWGLQRFVFVGKNVSGFTNASPTAVAKPKMPLGQSIRFILSSRYLALMTILVLCYGVCMNLVDVLRKHQLKLQYPNPEDYAAFMGILYMILGLSTCAIALIGGGVLRRLGWKIAALVTPLVIGGGGFLLCLCIISNNSMELLSALLETTPLFLIVVVATTENVLSKSVKYTLFDPTKEMAYIPLDEESRTKGKAAIDMFGMRFGKSCGSLIQQSLFIFVGPASVIAPYSLCILIVVTGVWIWAVVRLHARFADLSGEKV